MRYIELNPVRAATVDAPEDYRWSSVHTWPAYTIHASRPSRARGHDQIERLRAYKHWLDAGIAPDELRHPRAYARQERALDDGRFQRMVGTTQGRPVTCRPRGRPKPTRPRDET